MKKKYRMKGSPTLQFMSRKKISETAETHVDDTTATSQPSFTDVMELESHTQTNTATNEASNDTNEVDKIVTRNRGLNCDPLKIILKLKSDSQVVYLK